MADRDPQWLLIGPCGCPFGVMEGYLAANETEAFAEMYDDAESISAAQRRGMETRLIPFEEYIRDYYDAMHAPCPH